MKNEYNPDPDIALKTAILSKLRKLLIINNLPRMDSNHDKVIQSHLCYRYTTRQ
jgi:hypothetical protein